jgi:hypothetical protein
VNEAALVQLADRTREGDCKSQELRQRQLTGQVLQRLASLILECEDDASLVPRQGQGTQGEGWVENGSQLVFALKSPQDAGSRIFGNWRDAQDEAAGPIAMMPAEHELAVPAQYRDTTLIIDAHETTIARAPTGLKEYRCHVRRNGGYAA